ncbi:MAG TPA: hypothetical protein PLU22_24075, partial [Polyangiaceae bacterium]|nr:hypothetical protein [Polyangiaceae bacterium]
ALVAIVERLAARARGVDAPLPPAERAEPRPEAVVAFALAAFRRTFAPSLAGQAAAALPTEGTFSWEAWEIAWRAFELRMLAAVPSTARHAAALADYYRRRDAYDRRCEAGAAGDEWWEEDPPEIDCEALRPADARTCGEVTAGLALLDTSLRDLGDRTPTTAGASQQLAYGLEHLFLAGIPASAIDAGYRALATRLPPVAPPSDVSAPATNGTPPPAP